MFTVCRTLCLAVFLFMMIGCSGGSSSPIPSTGGNEGAMPAKESIKSPIAPLAYQKMLHTGMDVDWVKTDAGREAAQRSYEKGIDVPEIFKKRGLSHVRMRVKEDILSDPTLLEEIKHLVDQSIDAGLIPIIAYQDAEFKDDSTSDETLNHVKKWWQKVAETFKGYPYTFMQIIGLKYIKSRHGLVHGWLIITTMPTVQIHCLTVHLVAGYIAWKSRKFLRVS